jgi:hypothetical protein
VDLYGEITWKPDPSNQWLNFFMTASYSPAIDTLAFQGSMLGLWENAFGVSGLTFGNLGLSFATTVSYPPVVTTLGMTGELQIGAATFEGLFDAQVSDASTAIAVGGYINNLNLQDMYEWALNLTKLNTTTSFNALPSPVRAFMSGVTLNNAAFRFAPFAGYIGNIEFPPGYLIQFSADFMGEVAAFQLGIENTHYNGCNCEVFDLVMGFQITNANLIGAIGDDVVAPLAGWLRSKVDADTSLCVRYPCGMGWHHFHPTLNWCNKCENIAPSHALDAIASFNYASVFSIKELKLSKFGLVTSVLNGINPTLTASVEVLGQTYTWTGDVPFSALGSGVTEFKNAITAVLSSNFLAHEVELVAHVMSTDVCNALGQDCLPKICGWGYCSPSPCLESIVPGC